MRHCVMWMFPVALTICNNSSISDSGTNDASHMQMERGSEHCSRRRARQEAGGSWGIIETAAVQAVVPDCPRTNNSKGPGPPTRHPVFLGKGVGVHASGTPHNRSKGDGPNHPVVLEECHC